MRKSIPAEQYHELAKSRGFTFVGTYTGRTRDKVGWSCAKGHNWSAPYYVILAGSGCPYCCNHVTIVEQQYHKLAASRNFKFMGPYTGHTADPVEWECQAGHRWKTRYSHIKQGHGCPFCARNTQVPESQYHELAKSRGFVFVGPYTGSVLDKVEWECDKGHRWRTTHAVIYHQGCDCPHCTGFAQITEDKYHELATEKGYRFIGPYTGRVLDSVAWECDKGHTRKASYHNIKSDRRCPSCINMVNGAQASKVQIAMAELIGAEVNHQFDDTRRRIDCALPSHKIAIEYDCWYWHGHKVQQDDARAMELVDAGWKVISVKANTRLPTLEQLEECIAQLNEGRPYIELILDWGSGPLAKDVLGKSGR